MFQADGYKMDYGGHDTVITDNLFWKDGGDGQNCINTWPFLIGHGTVYKRNKCFLPHTLQVGHVSGSVCSGEGHSPGTDGDSPEPQTVCGVDFGENSYYSSGMEGGFRQNLTINTGGKQDVPYLDWQAAGNDPGSMIFHLPSDESLMFWARQKIGLPAGPEPPPPQPLPPAPPPHFPDTCIGQCAANHFCCTGNVSGCQRPSCVMGCAMGNFTASEALCVAMCKTATGRCSYNVTAGFVIEMCGTCPSGCPGCDDAGACTKGCQLAFKEVGAAGQGKSSQAHSNFITLLSR